MTSLPTYLYQYKQSKNYYFRIRQRSLDRMSYDTPSVYFVASLRTDNVHDAAFLALFVVTQLRNKTMNTDIHTPELLDGSKFVILPKDINDDLSAINTHITSRKQLKTRFTRALGFGKMMLSNGAIDVDSFDDSELQRAQTLQGMPLVNAKTDSHPKACINEQRMLSALVIKLCEHAEKVKNFSDEDKPFDANMFDSLSFSSLQQKYQQLTNDIVVAESVDKEVISTPSQVKKQHYSIAQLYKLFKKEKIASIKGGSVSHYDISFDYLSELIDLNSDVSVFDETLARRIKFDLIERKDQRCKDTDGKTLSVARINAYISNFSQFCQWCIEHKIAVNLNVNPFKGLRIKHTKNSKTPRREFSAPECNAILKYAPMKKVEAKEFRDDAYWFTKIGFFSGMRLNETANLLLSDVVKKEGVWCFDLKGSHLKNDNAIRVIPVHSKLINLRLIARLEDKKAEGQNYVFEQIRKGKKEGGKFGYGEKISRWFNRTVLRNIGIDKTHEKEILGNLIDYHCVRHTFIFQLKRLGVDMSYIKALVGHSGQHDLTRDVYGHNANHMIVNLQKAIELISYDD
jgi:integrase